MKKQQSKYKKGSGFSVPENYFQEFEAGIMYAVTSDKAEKELELLKEAVFSIPKNYFEDVEEKILQQTVFAAKNQPKVVPLYKKKSFYAAVASIAAIFILFMGIFEQQETISPSLNNVELSSLENYIEEENIDFSTAEISSFFEEGNFTEMDISGIENEELSDYLDEHLD